MRTITVETELNAPADVVWTGVQTPHAFNWIASPWILYPAAQRLNRPWQEGDAIEGWTFLFCFLPFSRHCLEICQLDQEQRRLVSAESGGLIRTWNHEIEVEPIHEARSHYVDRIHIDAGLLTPVVATFAALFYRHRQRRWRRLAPMLSAVEQARSTADRDARRDTGSLDSEPLVAH